MASENVPGPLKRRLGDMESPDGKLVEKVSRKMQIRDCKAADRSTAGPEHITSTVQSLKTVGNSGSGTAEKRGQAAVADEVGCSGDSSEAPSGKSLISKVNDTVPAQAVDHSGRSYSLHRLEDVINLLGEVKKKADSLRESTKANKSNTLLREVEHTYKYLAKQRDFLSVRADFPATEARYTLVDCAFRELICWPDNHSRAWVMDVAEVGGMPVCDRKVLEGTYEIDRVEGIKLGVNTLKDMVAALKESPVHFQEEGISGGRETSQYFKDAEALLLEWYNLRLRMVRVRWVPSKRGAEKHGKGQSDGAAGEAAIEQSSKASSDHPQATGPPAVKPGDDLLRSLITKPLGGIAHVSKVVGTEPVEGLPQSSEVDPGSDATAPPSNAPKAPKAHRRYGH